MSISRQSIEELKKVAKISDFILESTTGKLRGEKGMAICPFHGEKTPSMSFTDSENLFHCFGCKEGGDLYKFVQEIRGLEFADAVEEVATKYSFNLIYEKSSKFIPKKELIEKSNLLTKHFHEELMSSDSANKARSFLRSRGLNKIAIEEFKLGWIGTNEKNFVEFCKSNDLTSKDLEQIGIFNTNGKQFFINRILFPIFDKRDNVIGFGGRTISSKGPKYLNGPETLLYQKSRSLYTVPNFSESAKNNDMIFVFEGYIDVVAASMYGIKTAVAPCGTSLTNDHLSYIANFNSTIVLCFDNDMAGLEATKRVLNLNIRKEKALNIKVVEFNGYKDIGDMLEKDQLNNFQKFVDDKKDLVEFLFTEEIETKLKQDIRKNEIVYKLNDLMNMLSPIEVEEVKKLISDKLDIDIGVLEAEIDKPELNPRETTEVVSYTNEFETIFLSEMLRKNDKVLDEESNFILDDMGLSLRTKLHDLKEHRQSMASENLPEYLAKYFTISYDQSEFEEAKLRLYEKILDSNISELSNKLEVTTEKEESIEILSELAELKKKKEALYNTNK